MKVLKKYFIRRQNLKLEKQSLLRCYPKTISSIGIIVMPGFEPDTNFITKLNIVFGKKSQFFIFVLGKIKESREGYYSISFKDFNAIGALKSHDISEKFKALDLIIDMTKDRSSLKLYILNLATNAYKISSGTNFFDKYNLIINMTTTNQNLFAEEIFKYHNILRNGQK